MSLQDKIEVIVAEWKVERDLKCPECSRGLALGRHGCHWEDDAEESYAVGNCKAWPLSRRIKQLEEALAASQQAIAANEAADKHMRAAALAACAREAKLEEAKWWEHLVTDALPCPADCMYCARIGALERAVGEKGKA